jgi:hypothetical protein
MAKGETRVDTVWSIQGTGAHDAAEKALKDNTDAVHDSEEIRNAVQVYLDEIRSVEQSHDVIVRHTERTREHRTLEGFGGTTDHYVIYVEGEHIVLHVFDYKNGVGVPVDAWENKQVLSYFAVIESNYPGLIDVFRGTIVQPRAFSGDGIQTWETTIDRVREHEQAVREAMSQTHLKAGEHCRWCPAVLKCPELETRTLEVAQMEFSEIRDDRQKLAQLFELTPAIKTLLDKVPGAMMEHFRDGSGGVPGYKVVAKRLTNRQWLLPTQETLDALSQLGISRREALEEPKLKSPPQIEKGLPKDLKEEIDSLVIRRPTGFKVVPVTDRGEHVDVSTISDFTRIDDDNDSNE